MRTVRVALMVVVALGVALVGMPTADGAPSKVEVCHVDDDGDARLITISERAFETHVGHGDAAPGEPVPGRPGYEFDETCTPVQVETIFAVAYSDIVDDGAGYDPDVDVLISKLVDANGSGVPDAGDQVITDRYPLDPLATGFGSFGVTEHDVANVAVSADRCTAESPTGGVFQWYRPSGSELYGEGDTTIVPGLAAFGLTISDKIVDNGSTDAVLISRPQWAASEPEGTVADSGFSPTDDPFIDVALDCAS